MGVRKGRPGAGPDTDPLKVGQALPSSQLPHSALSDAKRGEDTALALGLETLPLILVLLESGYCGGVKTLHKAGLPPAGITQEVHMVTTGSCLLPHWSPSPLYSFLVP